MSGIALKKYPADLALVACFFVSDVDDMSIANYQGTSRAKWMKKKMSSELPKSL